MDSFNKLMEYFGEFPGIGPRQARRFAYFILTKNPAYTEELARLIIEAKKNVHICSMCFRFYTVGSASRAKEAQAAHICSILLQPHSKQWLTKYLMSAVGSFATKGICFLI